MALRGILILALVALLPNSALAYEGDGIIEEGEDETAELQRAVQNPGANRISLPFQNNTGYNVGPRERTQHVQHHQPGSPIATKEESTRKTRA